MLAVVFYVSYTASRGLPWESSYDVYVELPNATRLTETDAVRIRGVRVGRVSSVTALPPRQGRRAFARVKLSLDPSAGPLPTNTKVRVRQASVLGASYVDLTPGRSSRKVPESGTLPLRPATSPVDLTDLFDVFERSTARHIQSTLGELGAGFAGRGPALNTALASLADLLPPLTRVSHVLAAPDTRLRGFIRGYQSFSGALAPVSRELGGLVAGGSETFGALVSERSALAATIEALPPTESAVTSALTRLQPSLDGLAQLADDLRPAATLLPHALTRLNASLDAGVLPLRQLPPLARRLRTTLATLEDVTRLRSTDGALRKLTDTVRAAGTTLQVLTPAQRACNVIAIWAQYFAESSGTIGMGEGPTFVNLATTTSGAENEAFQNSKPSPNIGINYLPHENANECESGNEPHDGVTQVLSNPPGYQSTRHPDTDPPPGARERARRAGLLEPPEGWTP
ncbi:MAG: MlaD family protein [Thermoleophilaceae bacterium]